MSENEPKKTMWVSISNSQREAVLTDSYVLPNTETTEELWAVGDQVFTTFKHVREINPNIFSHVPLGEVKDESGKPVTVFQLKVQVKSAAESKRPQVASRGVLVGV